MSDRISEEDQILLTIEWIGCDRYGYLAWFESGGYAPSPESILESDSRRGDCLEFIKSLPDSSGMITHSEALERIVTLKKHPSPYRGVRFLAEKGLYVYTVTDNPKGPSAFERLLSPSSPIQVENLPEPYRTFLQLTSIRTQFAHAQQVDFSLIK